jgi:serine/threonine protein kinase
MLDIKADNIMADYHHDEEELVLDKVQLTDLDNAAYLPNGRYIKGMIAGNENWRSPEAFSKRKISKPADMFAFGIVVSASTQISVLLTNALSVFTPFLDV